MREATLRHKLRLPEEPEFALTDGFVTTLRRKPERAFEAVGGEVTPEVAGDQVKILRHCIEERPIGELMVIAGRANRTKFRDQVLKPLLEAGLLEMTSPDKPQSSKQRYRLTENGKAILARIVA